jgi:uncharacterized membrane protein YphA (DoxX/SURF4 family)
MDIAQFVLDLYFAAVLGVAGIAKVNNFSSFIHTLRDQYKMPDIHSEIIGRLFPWIEIFLAISLLTPILIYRFMIVCSVLLIFTLFLISKFLLLRGNHFKSECGCYGEITQNQNAFQNLITLIIQTALIILLGFITPFTSPLPWQYYLAVSVLLIGFYSWLLWKVWIRQRALATKDT